MVARYIESEALRAKLIRQAENWPWSSLWQRAHGNVKLTSWLSDWSVDLPQNLVAWANRTEIDEALEVLRVSAQWKRSVWQKGGSDGLG